MLFDVSFTITLALVWTVSKLKARGFIAHHLNFIRTNNFEYIKSTISTLPFI